MSGAGVNEWDNEYARLARMASQLRSGASPGTSQQQQQQQPQQQQQQQLSLHLSRLDQQLNQLPSLSPAEIQRRRRLIQHLQTGSTGSSGGIGGSPGYAPPGAGSPGGGQQQQQQQQSSQGQMSSQMAMAMRQQDDMIDDLAVGVGRLRDQTQVIGEEARMHVNLLGEMEGNLDIAHQGLEAETRRAAQLKEDQSVWRLQLILAGLSVLLVLLILMGLS